jgi:hypothetical protein
MPGSDQCTAQGTQGQGSGGQGSGNGLPQKAELKAITWDEEQQVVELSKLVRVQFNPETLKVAYTNQTSGGDQSGGSATQFSGQGTTKLTVDLLFDVTAPAPDTPDVDDVRELTKEINYFMRPDACESRLEGAPPGVRFLWGRFLFEGVMESMSETLELFSEEGVPLRATVSIGLAQQDIVFRFGEQQASNRGGSPAPGTRPQQAARAGDSLQQVAARAGNAAGWPEVARRNGIENPRSLAPGTPIDLSGLRRNR